MCAQSIRTSLTNHKHSALAMMCTQPLYKLCREGGEGGGDIDTPLPKAAKEVLILIASSMRTPSAPLAFNCEWHPHVHM